MITADAARQLARTNKPAGLDAIDAAIELAAKRGEVKIHINHKNGWGDTGIICETLKDRGFKVKLISDLRDGDYYDIRW